MVRFKLPADGQMTQEQKARLEKLAAMPEEDIDLSDIPEITAEQWATNRPGHYRPLKQPVTIRLDSDVVGWFKDHAGDKPYQTEINRVLRQHVARQLVQDRKKRA
jgi:uncharacterized protein (DUF4415 family)